MQTHLLADPGFTALGSIALRINVDHTSFVGTFSPGLLEVFLGNLSEANLPGFADSGPEEAIRFLAFMPIENASLRGVGKARDGRVDIDMLNAVAVGVMFDAKSGVGSLESLASDPTDALEGEDPVGIITEGLVLLQLSA